MTLGELMKVVEPFQAVEVYVCGENFLTYFGAMHSIPSELRSKNVESVHAHENEIDILIG